MQATSRLLISIIFWLFAAHAAPAQTLPGFLHAELEQSDAPNILSRMGHLHPTSSGYVTAGTWGDGEFSRAVFILTDRSFQPIQSYRINVQLPTPFGTTRWQESYGADVLPLGDNEYLILAAINMNPVMLLQPGSQNLDYAVLRVRVPANEQGAPQVLWAKRFGGDFNDTPHNVERTSDGGFIISGYSNPEQALNTASIALTFLVKLDAQGNLQWARRYRNNAADCRTTAFQLLTATLRRPVVQTQDGGFVFPLHCDENAYIVKVNTQGDVLWAKRFEAGSGFFDGFLNQDWNFGLGIATGTGGAIIGVRELPNGNLVFLGNQFSFFTSIWGNPTNGDGGGVVLPVSYVFTTTANGQFLHGNAFFRERFGDNNQPIEMIAHDFQPGPGNSLIVATGIRQNCFSGPECSFTPALLEINSAATGFDAAVTSAHEIISGSRHFSSHYPFALDFIRIAPPDAEGRIALSYDKNMVLKSFVGASPCAPELAGLHSFPITLDLQNRSIIHTSLSGADLAVGTLSPTALQRSLPCQTSATQEPIAAKDSGIFIAPTVSNGHFNIQLSGGDEWMGARFHLLDLQGRPCLSGVIQSDRQAVAAGHLPAGVYLVRIVKDAKFTVLKLMLQP